MNRFVTEKEEINIIENRDMICELCIYKSKSPSTCIAYENGKPLDVINNNVCKYFKENK